jgi:hypothetical protein
MKAFGGQIQEVMQRVEPNVQIVEVLSARVMTKEQPHDSESRTDHAVMEGRGEPRSN